MVISNLKTKPNKEKNRKENGCEQQRFTIPIFIDGKINQTRDFCQFVF